MVVFSGLLKKPESKKSIQCKALRFSGLRWHKRWRSHYLLMMFIIIILPTTRPFLLLLFPKLYRIHPWHQGSRHLHSGLYKNMSVKFWTFRKKIGKQIRKTDFRSWRWIRLKLDSLKSEHSCRSSNVLDFSKKWIKTYRSDKFK